MSEISELLSFKKSLVRDELIRDLLALTESLKADFVKVKPVHDRLSIANWEGTMEVLDLMIAQHKKLLADNGDHNCPSHIDPTFIKNMAGEIQKQLPDGWGFLLMAAPYGDGKGSLIYTSTMRREDALRVLKEFLLKAGAAEDWMKHFK